MEQCQQELKDMTNKIIDNHFERYSSIEIQQVDLGKATRFTDSNDFQGYYNQILNGQILINFFTF